MLKNLLLLSGFSTFVVIIIIGLNIYHNFTLTALPASTQKHVIPIPQSFDKKTLSELKKRTPIIINLQEKSAVISEDTKEGTPLSPTPSITTQTESSQSAVPTLTQPETPNQP
jgi:hypothetical protein